MQKTSTFQSSQDRKKAIDNEQISTNKVVSVSYLFEQMS